MSNDLINNLTILANLIGKNTLETAKISLYQKLLLIAKAYHKTISVTKEYDSLFALYNKEDDKYIYVTIKPDNLKKATNELIKHKFPLNKVEIFTSFEVPNPPNNLHIITFLLNNIEELFNSLHVTSNVSLNYSDTLFNRVRNDTNTQNIKNLVCFIDNLAF